MSLLAGLNAGAPLSHALNEVYMYQVVGVLLAAGRGLRFDPEGRRDKLLAKLDAGRTVLHQSALHLQHWVDRLVVVTRPGRSATLQSACPGLDAVWVEAPDADLGMGASLKAAVLALAPPQHGWMIGLADMPWILPQTYQQVRAVLEQGVDVVRPVHGGQPGHPVGCASSLLDCIISMPIDAGLGPMFRQPGRGIQALDVTDPGCTRDVDFPADLD